MHYSDITDQPNEKTERINAFLASNSYQVAERALEIGSQNTGADGLIDAIIYEIQMNNAPLKQLIEQTLSGGITNGGVDLKIQVMETALRFFTGQAEMELLREEGLL